MVRVLSDEEVATALVSLAHWEHRDGGLVRSVPTGDRSGMRAAVERVAGADGDHVAAVEDPGGLVVRVATASGGVSDTDVEVAARIEQAIEMGGSEARPRPP